MGTIRSFRIEAKRFDISLEAGNAKQIKIKGEWETCLFRVFEQRRSPVVIEVRRGTRY
jgi:hypothetical protein